MSGIRLGLIIFLGFFVWTPYVSGSKNLENTIKELKAENTRLRHELAMEEEASKLLGQKFLKATEEKVVIENELKEAQEKIKNLEEELSRTRKIMEDEINSYRKKIGAVQEEMSEMKKKMAIISDQNKMRAYQETLEKENSALKETLLQKEKELKTLPELKTQLSAKPQEVKPPPPPEPKEEIKTAILPDRYDEAEIGRIVSVSQEFNFVIISFVKREGITMDKIFSVYRGEKKTGEVKVTRLRDKYIFAAIIGLTSGEEIKEGDSIVEK